MRAVVFFAGLCFLFLNGYQSTFTVTRNAGAGGTAAQHIRKKQQITFENPGQDYIFVNGVNLCSQEEDMSGDDEDDANHLFSRAFRLPANFYLTLSRPFTVNHLHSSFKASRPFCRLLSHKYITQRALRI